MTKFFAVSAAALLMGTYGCPAGARAWCDEDCAYAHEEAAYERAYSREEAADEGYAVDAGRGRRSSQNEKQAARAKASEAPEPRTAPATKRAAEPASTDDKRRSRTGIANENSSITSGSTVLAEDDSPSRATVRREVGCKSFFPSVGMTLSVPCD